MAIRMNMGFNALLVLCLVLVVLPSQVHAFGAGNIASISAVEGKNWRHGDIEDMLKTVAFIKGHKWTSTMIKRVYFGNWLRDYSQAMDVGTLKSVQADTIRILVWILSFMTFGYATAEFEVTSDRLGTYRPEEHIDNPKDYADNQDARQYDARLRGPVRQVELDIDPETGMKNYIANERGDWSTSSGYIKYSLARSIHHGRLYSQNRNEEDLCEALRCLGQGLHTLEDFAAHTNYCELALREMGFRNVFPHTGTRTEMNVQGRRIYPLVTGTFGMVDFFHSVLGEATDHFTQSEVNEMDIALGDAQTNTSSGSASALTALLGKVPGTRDLVNEAEELRRRSDEQESRNRGGGHRTSYSARGSTRSFDDFDSGSSRGYRAARADDSNQDSSGGLPGLPDFDANKTISQIYPILQFRDNVVRKLSSIIETIPGLETLVETITETLTVFVMSLLAPFIRPIINAASKQLQAGSSSVIDASGQHQYEPWTDPHCTDPTHSLLSKDHFSNILNDPAGQVASAILKYVAPRVLYAWENTNISERQVVDDCLKVFHHPALRDMHNEAHRTMYEAVESWVNSRSDRGSGLNDILSAEGVKAGKNQTGGGDHSHGHGHSHSHAPQQSYNQSGQSQYRPPQQQQQQQSSSSPFDQLSGLPIPGISKLSSAFSHFGLGGSSRGDEDSQQAPPPPEPQHQEHHHHQSYHERSHERQDYESRHQGHKSHHSGDHHSSHESRHHGHGGGRSADYYNESPSSHDDDDDDSGSQKHSKRRHHKKRHSHSHDQDDDSGYSHGSGQGYRQGYGQGYEQGHGQGYGQGYGGGYGSGGYGSGGSRW
ncbi:heterokaryon incompatibility protein Het-C-domain-containing protein [Aspergillus bertholletiae]|uniref:Heterokaryon incompatibility protein Het-C-domain-containing protein n=1 Tax=Aspergillus bertholletiae TaxID=1226010 RepID=A0A5N7BEF3_9EURO|nr:heterokaryon incompatibility protein Het-C-domain-containing protein [Aspergillus bertholletiae]